MKKQNCLLHCVQFRYIWGRARRQSWGTVKRFGRKFSV